MAERKEADVIKRYNISSKADLDGLYSRLIGEIAQMFKESERPKIVRLLVAIFDRNAKDVALLDELREHLKKSGATVENLYSWVRRKKIHGAVYSGFGFEVPLFKTVYALFERTCIEYNVRPEDLVSYLTPLINQFLHKVFSLLLSYDVKSQELLLARIAVLQSKFL